MKFWNRVYAEFFFRGHLVNLGKEEVPGGLEKW